jgi:proteasome lid subunit RPN8/RPN11
MTDGLSFEIDNEVTRRIRQHARTHMTTEVCGVLIGENKDGVVAVRASIEATHASQAGTHVTFTQDAWEAIYRVKDESYPEDRIVGWYHSHPGFGVFLSEHDTFIHRNFFSSPDQLAWVYDPHTDEEGCFGWVEGEIHRVSLFSTRDNSGDGSERTPKEMEPAQPEASERKSGGGTLPWVRWSVTTLSYVAAMVLGFAIAHFLFPRFLLVTIDPATGEPRLLLPQASRQGQPAVDPNAGRSH